MNRNFEDRKSTKVYAKSEENQAIIKTLNMYGRVPEQWELLNEIERLNNIINEFEDKIDTLKIEISSLMSRYFYEKDFQIEDAHLDKLLRIIDNDVDLKESNEPSFEEMVNFVENVCQDIKSQSILDEELKGESNEKN